MNKFFLILSIFGYISCKQGSASKSEAQNTGTAVSENKTQPDPNSNYTQENLSWFYSVPFVIIPAGTFTMGSPPKEPGRQNDENLLKL